LAGVKVVCAVAGSGVDNAAALIERDVVGEDAGNFYGHEGMLKFHALEIAALECTADLGFLDSALCL
jgi:hypothetical protein